MKSYTQDLYECLKKQISKAVGEDNPELESILRDLEILNEGNIKNPVTKAPNSAQKDIDLKKIVEEERKAISKNHFYVAMLDIDNFGEFNKRYGEDVGNEVLKGTTKILEEALRNNDFIRNVVKEGHSYHLHGEEKLAIYTCASDEDAINVAERIRTALEEKSEEEIGYKVTESIGLTRWHLESESYDEAQKRADKNMQVAKRKGKNQVYFEDKPRNY